MTRLMAAVLGLLLGAMLALAPVAAWANPLTQALEAAGAEIQATQTDPDLGRTTIDGIALSIGEGALTVARAEADGLNGDRLRLSDVALTLPGGTQLNAKGLSLTGVTVSSHDGMTGLAFERAEALFVRIETGTPALIRTLVLENGTLALDAPGGPMLIMAHENARLAADGIDVAVSDMALLPVAGGVAPASLPRMLTAMGYTRLKGSLGVMLDSERMTLKISGDDLGSLTVRAMLDRTDRRAEAVTLVPGIAAALPLDPAVRTVSIDYEDMTLAKRTLDLLAHQQGISPEMVGTRMAMGLAVTASLLGPAVSTRLEPVTASLGDFLRNPDRLSLSLHSEEPLSAKDLWSPKLLDKRVLHGLTLDARSGAR